MKVISKLYIIDMYNILKRFHKQNVVVIVD